MSEVAEAHRRGEQAAAEKAQWVDRWLPREIILPSALVWLFGKWVFAQQKRQGYGHIEPESEFVHGFIVRFHRERTPFYYE